MHYAQIILTLASDLHIGSGRAGMLAKTHRFVPGHVLTYALAAAIGKQTGGGYPQFVEALERVRQTLRCGPLFFLNPAQPEQALWPTLHSETIEQQFLIASNHVTLDYASRSGVNGALFEVEAIAANVVRGANKGRSTRLVGGLWFGDHRLSGRSVCDWLGDCLLGGELKTGLGRIAKVEWSESAAQYAGIGRVDGDGLHLESGELLPGVSLQGVSNAAIYPWMGRLYDRRKGFGRRLSEPVFVAFDAKVERTGCFMPAMNDKGLGCWERC